MSPIRTTGQILKDLRESKEWSQQQVAAMLNISNSTLSKIENNNRTIDAMLLNKFAEVYGVSTDYLVGREVIRDGSDKPYTPQSQNIEFIPIPIYKQIRTNTLGLPYYEDFLGYRMISKEDVKEGQYFYLVVHDDHMKDAGIDEGCIVLVRQQSTVKSGNIAIIKLKQEPTQIRKIFLQANDLMIVQAGNYYIAPQIYHQNEVQILGQVVEWTKKL